MFQRISLEIVAKKFEKIFTVDLTLTTYCQINCEYFVNKFLFSKKQSHRNQQNLHRRFDTYYIMTNPRAVKIQVSIFVAFLENINFTCRKVWSR